MDLAFGERRYNKIAWYRNMDGRGTRRSAAHRVQERVFATSVAVADIDGDADDLGRELR